MKIAELILCNYQQFGNVRFDFTHPETHEPLNRICLIGRNGTGKSTILKMIYKTLQEDQVMRSGSRPPFARSMKVSVEKDINIWMTQVFFYPPYDTEKAPSPLCFTDDSSAVYKFMEEFNNKYSKLEDNFENHTKLRDARYDVNKLVFDKNNNEEIYENTLMGALRSDYNDLSSIKTIFWDSEENINPFNNGNSLPQTNLNAALELSKNFPNHHILTTSEPSVADFWKLLIYHYKERQNKFQLFAEANEELPYKTLRERFDAENPNILEKIKALWDKILAPAGLELDLETAKMPLQLTDNLAAYIHRVDSKERIPYAALSTGIRNFIFKIGHLYSLYFEKAVKDPILLIDEPESSLYPDVLYDLFEPENGHLSFLKNSDTQLFVATHSPLIASQFEPYERFILDFDEHGYVTVERGHAPIGDDSNDLLRKDFHTEPLNRHPKAQAAWQRYLDLGKQIKKAISEPSDALINEYLDLQKQYSFPKNNIG